MWRGFSRVRTTRLSGMGLGRIPWHECVRWAQHEGLDGEETESFIDLVERLDLEEHKLESDKADQKGKSDGADGKTSPGDRQSRREAGRE